MHPQKSKLKGNYRHMIEDDTDTSTYQNPSPQVRDKINKLLADDAAQQKRTWSYYQEIKKADLNKYLSPKVQQQMHRDASDLGSAFQDGDF
jgi:hypothetical protein